MLCMQGAAALSSPPPCMESPIPGECSQFKSAIFPASPCLSSFHNDSILQALRERCFYQTSYWIPCRPGFMDLQWRFSDLPHSQQNKDFNQYSNRHRVCYNGQCFLLCRRSYHHPRSDIQREEFSAPFHDCIPYICLRHHLREFG